MSWLNEAGRRSIRSRWGVGAIALLLCLPAAIRAEAADSERVDANWFGQSTMTGDWGGVRTKLANDGVVLHGGYLSEMAGNPVGGRSQGVAYAHQVELGAEIDLAKLTGVDLGMLSVSFTERAGQSLSAQHVGDVEEVQEIFGSGQTVRLSRLAIRRALSQHVEAGIGWSNTEENFASSSVYWGKALYCLYQSLAFCGKPPTLGQNSGYSFIPRAVPSGWAKFYPTNDHSIVVAVGAYAADPTIQNSHSGFKLGTHDDSGALLPFELGYHRGDSDEYGAYPGTYRIGGYYDTSRVNDVRSNAKAYVPSSVPLTGLPTEKVGGRYGGWALADQMIERDQADPKRGMVAFAVFTYGDTRTALLPFYGEVGLARKGSFANRPSDFIAAGFFVAAVNTRLAQYEGDLAQRGFAVARQAQEMGSELNYAFQEGWITIRPGLQYKWHPSGENEIRNALVLDLQTTIEF